MANYCMRCMHEKNEGEFCIHCGTFKMEENFPHALRQGTILEGRYLVGSIIGQGGFGITYIGRDLRLDMIVAIKEYYPNGYTNRNSDVDLSITITNKENLEFIQDGIQKFLGEARALAKFSRKPGVVDVRDYFEANSTAYIVMEYLDGIDLRTYLKSKGSIPVAQLLEVFEPVLDTLELIHNSGIIHRDISPDNIMILKNGTLKLMDFGAARMVNYEDYRSMSIMLKSGYAPEEQYRTRGAQGAWTDVYAVCATLYKCMTGRNADDALDRLSEDTMEWPSQMGVAISKTQEAALKKGMAVKAQNRCQNIAELKALLYQKEEIKNEKDVKKAIPTQKPKQEKKTDDKKKPVVSQEKNTKKPPIIPIIAGLCVVVVLGVIALVGFGGNKSNEKKEDVTREATQNVEENNVEENKAEEPIVETETIEYVFLNDMEVSNQSGKLWTRSENELDYYTHTIEDPQWGNPDTPGHTSGPVKDVKGNTYTYGLCIDGLKGDDCHISYDLNQEYTKFSGTYGCPENPIMAKAVPKYTKYFEVYGDGELLFVSVELDYTANPLKFEIDVEGIETLKIVFPANGGPNEIVTLFDAKLTKK